MNTSRIPEILRREAGFTFSGITIEKLRGDASVRSYYRITLHDSQIQSVVLMDLNESIKVSDPFQYPFLNIYRHLNGIGCRIPRIFFFNLEEGIIILEDVGDITMQEYLAGKSEEEFIRIYRKAIDELVLIQTVGTERLNDECIASHVCFDTEKFMFEIDFFLKHMIEGLLGRKITDCDLNILRKEFYFICDILSHEPRFFTHRDYHSRNIMIHTDEIRIIDFQDARMGPLQYDIASLLRDSYTIISDEIRNRILSYYMDNLIEHGCRIDNRERFMEIFDLMSIQRNLKAVGTFAYQKVVRGKDDYLSYIPATLSYVRENLEKFPWLRNLKKVLFDYLE